MRTLLILAMLCPLLALGQSTKITPLTIGDTIAGYRLFKHH